MYDTGSLTASGRSLLASATAANKIVFTKALTDTTYRDAATIASISGSIPYSSVGDAVAQIYGVSSFEESCSITARFTNIQSALNIHGVWVMARLENQSDDQAVPFGAVMDTDTVYIPSTAVIDSMIDVVVSLSFDNGSGTASILEAGAASPESVTALRGDVFGNAKNISRLYDAFIKAQAYADEGEAFNLDPHAILYLKTQTPSWMGIGGTPDSYRVTDICDMYMAVVCVYSSNTYVNIFDLREATVSGEQLRLGAPVVYSRLGDESSSYGYVTIAKVGGQYFAFAYTNSSSTNLWWYNDSFGHGSGNHVTGRGAVMAINTFTAGGYTFNRGWWYQIESGTAIGARAIGGEFIIMTKDIANTASIYLKQCTLSPSSATMPLGGTSNQMTSPIANCYIDRTLAGGSYNYINNMHVLKRDDFYLAIGSYYDNGAGKFKGLGAAMVNGYTGNGTAITNQFARIYGTSVSSYNSLFYRACGFPYDYSTSTDIASFFNNYQDTQSPKITKTYDGIIYTSTDYSNSYYLASKSSIVEGGYSGYIDPPWTVSADFNALTANGHTYRTVYDMAHAVMLADCGSIQRDAFGSTEFVGGYDFVQGVGLIAGMANIDDTSFIWLAFAPPTHGSAYKVLGKI